MKSLCYGFSWAKEKNFHHKIFILSKNELPMQNDILLSEADYN